MQPATRVMKIAPAAIAGKGRGIFATAPIAGGEVIDEACSVELSEAQCDIIETTNVGDYYFQHPGNPDGGLLVLGLPSLCNHAEDYNTETFTTHDPALGWTVRLIARRDIAAGEEITRFYACPVWFEKH